MTMGTTTENIGRQALRPAPGGMLSLNIMDEVERLKRKPEWLSGDRLGVSLVKDDALNIFLMMLKKGARLGEHRTKGPIALYLFSGSVRFEAAGKDAELLPGSITALDREIAHEVEALEDSVALLITAIE